MRCNIDSPGKTNFQIAILADRHQLLEGIEGPVPIDWLICKQRDNRWLDFSDGDGLISAVDLEDPVFDLPLLLSVLVIGDSDAFVDVEQRWMRALPSTGVSFKRLPEWNVNTFLCAAIESLANDLAAQRRHAGRAALDLATYRNEFDRIQRNFSRLEAYVGRHSLQRPIELFEYGPDLTAGKVTKHSKKMDGVNASAARMLVQTLPVDSLGFSNISLYVIARPEVEEDTLRIKLNAIETGRVYGEWLLRASDAQIGWVELALDYAIDESALGLALEIEWPSTDSAWGLALGQPHPYEEFCAQIDGSRSLRAPLGLRLSGGLPGVRVTATTTAIRPVGLPSLLAAFVPSEVLATVEQVSPVPAEGKVNLVSYDQEIGCLTVHPRVGGLAVARLRVTPPANAWRLSTQIFLAHEKASPTDFGLLVGWPREESKDIARLDRLETPSPNFSGWVTLASLESRSISVVLAVPPEGPLSVYLLTRQGPDVSPDFCWARFSNLEFNLLKAAISNEVETKNPVAYSTALVGNSK